MSDNDKKSNSFGKQLSVNDCDRRDRSGRSNNYRQRSPKSYSDRERSTDRDRRNRDRDVGNRGDSRYQHRGERSRRNYDDDRRDRRRSDDGRPSWDNNRVKRHAEMIQERKMIWSKGKDTSSASMTDESNPTSSSATIITTIGNSNDASESAWTSRLAAATNDAKQVSKFQRLMGMKKVDAPVTSSDPDANSSSSTASKLIDEKLELERKRQDELTAQLDRQYAMARATTHMGRGKGLGFSG